MALTETKKVVVTGLSNEEFLARHARAGCVGLSGGDTPIDLAIRRAQRHLDPARNWATWSHAFIFQGERIDGYHWVIESDLQFHHKHIQLGVQENRVTKYFDEENYKRLAVLDFGLSPTQVRALLREALELAANRERYSLRELIGTLIALRHPKLRSETNLLYQQRSVFCSALVQHLFRGISLDLAPGVNAKHTAPEDIANTAVPHTIYELDRPASPIAQRLQNIAKIRATAKARIRQITSRKTSRP